VKQHCVSLKISVCILLALALLCLVSFALADGTCGANLTWTFSGSVLTISGTGAMDNWLLSNPWKDYNKEITGVVIEEGVTSIGDYAFYMCETLDKITIPGTVTKIGNHAFSWCYELSDIRLPNSLAEIGNSAFELCSGIATLTIPDGVTIIGDYAFSQCGGLTSLVLHEGLTSIGTNAFYSCGKLDRITIPASVTFIGDTPFLYCTSLREIAVNEGSASYASIDGVLYSRDHTRLIAYPGNRQTPTYSIADGVTTIGNSAFRPNQHLTSITIPPSVQVIENDAFNRCNKLQKLEIPQGVTGIGDTAFVGCSALQSISFPSTLQSIGTNLFEACGKLTSIDVAEGNGMFASQDGVLFTADRTCLIAYPAGRKQVTYTVPEGVTTIGEYAFFCNRILKSVALPESLITIEKNAFSGSDITGVQLPSHLAVIEYGAFGSCDNLAQVTIPASVLLLGDGAFNGCDSLVSVTIEGAETSLSKWGVFDYCHKNLVINGLPGSTAEIHANGKGIPFAPIAVDEMKTEDSWTCSRCNTTNTGGKFCPECGQARARP